MSELPELPSAPRRTRPLPAGGLEAALTAGARRRHRAMSAAVGVATAVALVLAAAITLPDTGRPDSLEVAETPAPAPSPVVSALERTPGPDSPVTAPDAPSPRLGDPAGGEGPGVGPALPGARLDGSAPAVDRAPIGPFPPSPAPSAAPPAAPAPAVQSRPAYREDTDEDAAGSPACMAGTAVGGGCTYSSGGPTADVVRRGEQAQVVFGLCTSRDDIGDHVFFFDGGQEKEVVVTPQDDVSKQTFRFSSTVRYVEGAHERRLRRGACIQWTGRWDLVTTDGEPVPAGSYEMTMRVRADREVYENGPAVESPLDATVAARITVID